MQLFRLGDRGRETPVITGDDGVIYRLDRLTADIDPEFSPMTASPGPGPRSRPDSPFSRGAEAIRVGAPISKPGAVL